MYCPKCGKELKDDEINFCPACGKNLSDFKQPKIPEPVFHLITDKIIADEITFIEPKIETPSDSLPPKEPDRKRKKLKIFDVSQHKPKKWGWGWFFVAFIIFKTFEKDLGIDDNLRNAISLIALTLSILIYFLFRNRIFKSFPNIYLRAVSAGVISIFATMALAMLILQFLPTQRNLYNEFFNKLTSIQVGYIQEAKILDQELVNISSKTIANSSNEKEYQQNLNVVNDYLKTSLRRFQVNKKLIMTTQEILDEYESKLSFIPSELYPPKILYNELLVGYDQLSEKTNECYSNLMNYYEALISKQDESSYYSDYEKFAGEVESLASSIDKKYTVYMIDHINGMTTYLRKQKYIQGKY